VIESIPQSESPKPDSVSERLSNDGSDQEEFRPAQEVFHDPSELDFLMQHGGATHDIALARQSLFVKFDPLVTGRPSMFPSRSSDAGTFLSVKNNKLNGIFNLYLDICVHKEMKQFLLKKLPPVNLLEKVYSSLAHHILQVRPKWKKRNRLKRQIHLSA
jgi:hypothetical protein